MAYTSGTVADFSTLLSTVIAFVTGDPGTAGKDWSIVMNENTKDAGIAEPFGSACKQYVLSNTGVSGTELIMVGIREWTYSGGGAYGWDLNCYTSRVSGQKWNDNSSSHGQTSYNTTWNRYTNHPHFPLINDVMYYWIFSNKQRIVVVAKTASYYQSCYIGYGTRLGSPSQYPYPLCAIGTIAGNRAYSENSAYHRYFIRPYIYGADGAGGDNICSAFVVGADNTYNTIQASYGTTRFIPTYSGYYTILSPLPALTINNTILLNPVYIMMNNNILMVLDGVAHTSCINIQSEAIISVGADTWTIIQDVNRITPNDYMAIKQA